MNILSHNLPNECMWYLYIPNITVLFLIYICVCIFFDLGVIKVGNNFAPKESGEAKLANMLIGAC